MFCSKCGVKLPQKANKCPSCGAPAPAEEYCGGFWGLTKENRPEMQNKAAEFEDNQIKESRPSEKENKAIRKYKKNIKNLFLITVILAAVALAEFVFIIMLAAGSGGTEQTEPAANIVTSENETEKIGGEIGGEIGGDKSDVEKIYGETQENPVQYQEPTENFEETTENSYEDMQEYNREDVTENENGGIFQNDRKEDIASQF